MDGPHDMEGIAYVSDKVLMWSLVVLGIANLIIVAGGAVLLWKRRGYSVDTTAILAKIGETHDKVGLAAAAVVSEINRKYAAIEDQIEDARIQMGTMDLKHDSHQRAVASWLHTLMERFGFLKAGHQPGPQEYRKAS